MEHWNEVRSAYAVARLGTVSAAATELSVHRATIIRHINTLEASLGARLFQRHARGYTPTEAGSDLARVARATREQFAQLAVRARGHESTVTGELIVTSIEMVSPIVTRAIARFREEHLGVTVRYIASGRILQLAYGEAHLAVRAGSRPEHPDNVVRAFFPLRSTFYAHTRYVERYGLPRSEAELEGHHFVSHADPSRAPLFSWLESVVPARNIVLRSGSQRVLMESLLAGIGIGFMPVFQAATLPELHEVMAPRPDWSVPLWLVAHVDQHRTAKVRAFSQVLRQVAEEAHEEEVSAPLVRGEPS